MRRAYTRQPHAHSAEAAQIGRDTLAIVGSVLPPTLCTAAIVWWACAGHIDANEMVGALLLDLALCGIGATTIVDVYRAARYRAWRRRRVSALAASFVDWVDTERANWSNHP